MYCSLWIVAAIACIGNIVVIVSRILMKSQNEVDSVFIFNLSFADLLMALYLIIIAAQDHFTRDVYGYFDVKWRKSILCQIAGK